MSNIWEQKDRFDVTKNRVSQEEWNIIAQEEQNILLGNGLISNDLALSNSDRLRFLKSINQSVLQRQFFDATGTNNYTLIPISYNSLVVTPIDFTKPLLCSFLVPSSNTGACTIVISGASLVSKPLVDISGNALIAGKLIIGDFVTVMWNYSLDKWQVIYSLLGTKTALPLGYKNGFILSNNTITPNTKIDITTGAARSINNDFDLITTSAFTKDINAIFVAGNNQGGRASSVALTNATWYHIFVISNGTTTDFYFDTSVSAGNKPSGYNYYRRIGSIYYIDSTNGIRRFYQSYNIFKYKTMVQDLNGPSSTTATLLTLSAPPSTEAIIECDIMEAAAGGTRFWLLTETNYIDVAPSTTNFSIKIDTPGGSQQSNTTELRRVLDANRQLRSRANSNGGATHTINTIGWVDYFDF